MEISESDAVWMQKSPVAEALAVVELGGDPGQAPLEVSQHELKGLCPLLLRVELGLDGVGAPTTTRVLNLSLLHVHPGVETHSWLDLKQH